MTDTICYMCRIRYASVKSLDNHGNRVHGSPRSSWAKRPADWKVGTPVSAAQRGRIASATAKPCVNSVVGLIDSVQARKSDSYAGLIKKAKPPTESEKIATSLPWLKLPKTSKGCAQVVRHCDASLKIVGLPAEVKEFLTSLRGYVEAAGHQLRTREESSDAQAA